jgi:predicted NACHT family NTPase
VRLWGLADPSRRVTLKGHREIIYSVAFSPDGKTLASGAGDNTVRLWEVATGQLRAVLPGRGERGGRVYAVAFTPDGGTLAAGCLDGTVLLWDLRTRTEKAVLARHADYVLCVAVSPDGRLLASGSIDRTIRLWDLRSGRLRQTCAIR